MFTAPTLTQVIINPHQPQAARDLTDTHRMHQQVMRLCCPHDFGPGARAAAGVLYRIETTGMATALLVQSLTSPDTSALPSGYGQAKTKDLGPLLHTLSEGMQVRYRLACAPCRTKHVAGKRGKRYGLSGEDAALWWKRTAQQSGMTLDSAQIRDERRISGRSRSGNGPQHWLVEFEGLATIADADVVRHAVIAGIGRGKAYGCGLLSLAPIT